MREGRSAPPVTGMAPWRSTWQRYRWIAALACIALAVGMPTPVAAANLVLYSYVIIGPDATLQIRGRTVRLGGIYIPPTSRICDTRLRPTECGSRAAVALRFKVQGFVRCEVFDRDPDRTYVATCCYDDIHLAEWLIREGWALATPNAPFSYVAAERIARAQKRGVWGFPA